jgi:caspase domain-containing protein
VERFQTRGVWVRLATLLVGLAIANFALAGAKKRAIVAGNNYGGSSRVPLRFAEEDAKRLSRVLIELGRFDKDQVQLILGASAEELLKAIQTMSAGSQKSATDDGSLFLFFYSGHADGESLMTGDDRLGITELKQAVEATGNDVSLVILDACNSGAAVREKGGRSAPSFLRFNDTPRAKGRIILTSAAASELAQESDEIGSSFFTHYLVSGLMGDADRSGDKRITLEEIYRYVFDRTVLRTADTLPGVQHPAFLYELEGEGSIVLTDLNNEASGIMLDKNSTGNYLVFDSQRLSVVAELEKHTGDKRLLPLSPGKYLVKKRLADHLLVAEVQIKPGVRLVLRDEDMRKTDFETPTAKGWDLALRSKPSKWEAQAAFGWTAFSRAPAGGVWSFPTSGVSLRLRGWPAQQWNTRFGVTAGAWQHSSPVEDRRLNFTLLQLAGSFAIGRALEYGPFTAEFGGQTALVLLQRRFDDNGYSGTDQSVGCGLGPYALASVQLGLIRIALEIGGGVQFFPKADNVVIPYVYAGITLGFKL